ncbi:FBD-associated F-box protein At4g10400-like isoform X1 [Rosa rugosa]|uniref:FBD-associated F-box protein At4g10400-like isoform X1 n=2 Tax=Rosa rugosa TaxID=74645 RepID=UPI002B406B4B|nr:FBD-associated F-box protein At4g10400-like isoform X1 [Rosa rugosa]XP_062015506.1 FBD-associated F-box protein At4g10400-like isoform X1 [Rosa rugosa]
MDSMAKPEDRISKLPNEVVYCILSFLPTVDAVRTTVLSKRWSKMWAKLKTLNFDSNKKEFRDYEEAFSFVTFVTRVLFFRKVPEIHKFRLKMPYPQYIPHIEDWVFTAVIRNVVELDLHVFETGVDVFVLPECIYWCKTLRVLKLHLTPWTRTDDPPASGCFPSLKFLHVSVYNPQETTMNLLFSCCPVLEGLTIDGTIDGNTGDHVNYNFKVSAPELKTLRISLENIYDPVDVHINAPKLENLDLKRLGLTNCFLIGSTKSLVNASIAFREHFEVDKKLDLSTFAMALLDQISNVKFLSLSAHCLEDLHLPEDWHLPVFHNVNQLRLAFWEHNLLELLAVFLNSAPTLEDLVLEDRTEGYTELSESHWNPPKEVPAGLSSNLKTISFKGFKGRLFEMEMIKYLLKNGQLLNKMTISTSLHLSYDRQNELYTEFMMFHRAATCHVEFVHMQV